MIRRPPRSPLFPYPPLFRSPRGPGIGGRERPDDPEPLGGVVQPEPDHQQQRERDLVALRGLPDREALREVVQADAGRDRKSTRLNSSHLVISYAVFCLKKKK